MKVRIVNTYRKYNICDEIASREYKLHFPYVLKVIKYMVVLDRVLNNGIILLHIFEL